MQNQYFKKGVLLINIGTPEKPESNSIRKFLREFLMDPRVINIPFIFRWLLLNLIILPRRPAKVAIKYQRIWESGGSPLKIYSQKIKQKLNQSLGNNYIVDIAMRYSDPSIQVGIRRLMKQNISELLILPMFPQYSSATTGSVIEKVLHEIQKMNFYPKIKIQNAFYDYPDYIKAVAAIGKKHNPETFDHILFSFHGLPISQIKDRSEKNECFSASDCCEKVSAKNFSCYRHQCFQTAHLIAQALKIPRHNYSIGFQSRLGKAEWIQPYTVDQIHIFPKNGVKKLLVFCPSFVIDCLETLDEVGNELTADFLQQGGEKLSLVPALNDQALWIETLIKWIKKDDFK